MWKWSDLKRIFMRKAVSDVSSSAIITWPVYYPNPEATVGGTAYVPEDPHITILYIPDINNPNLGFTKEDVIEAIKETDFARMLLVHVSGLEWFGPDADIPVLTVEHAYLHIYRDTVKAALAKRGIVVEETFPTYRPHVTITDLAAVDRLYPERLLTGLVQLWWGDTKYEISDRGAVQKV